MDQRLTRLEHGARQPRLAIEADGPANTKTRERTEGAATAVRAVHGDNCSADRVDPDSMCSTSFANDCTRPPAPTCSGENALVDNRAAAPKSCLPSLDMRSPTAAGGSLPTDEASTATKITLNQPPLRLYSAEETNFKKSSTLCVSYDSSVFQKSSLPAAPYCRRVIKIKSGENRMFDPGNSQGRLRDCPFMGTWRALLYGEVMRVGAAG